MINNMIVLINYNGYIGLGVYVLSIFVLHTITKNTRYNFSFYDEQNRWKRILLGLIDLVEETIGLYDTDGGDQSSNGTSHVLKVDQAT